MAKIYAISPPQIILEEFIPKLKSVLEAGNVGLFQLRVKEKNQIENLSRQIMPVCHKYNVPFILNDFPELAKKTGADGVHLGEESDDYDSARKILGNKHIGISCYADYARAEYFANKGADLVSFGQFYPTKTKPPKGIADIELLKKWKANHKTPCSVIGGLTPERAKPLAEAGADYICMVSALWS